LTPYFCIFLEKYKKYFFSINLVISLFLFYFCVLKINHENYKKNIKIQKNLENKIKKYIAAIEIGSIIEYHKQKLSLEIFGP
jgi:hypothetical protein